ncbi:MAG: PaaI family thioesterase [Rhodospirillaceae bacterium]
MEKPPPIKARELLGGDAIGFNPDTGVGSVRYVPDAGLMNPAGTVLGGYLSAMLDDVAGLATWYAGGKRFFATAQMSTSFLRGAKEGEALIGESTVTGHGKRQAFAEATLTRESDGKIIAKATLVQTFLD